MSCCKSLQVFNLQILLPSLLLSHKHKCHSITKQNKLLQGLSMYWLYFGGKTARFLFARAMWALRGHACKNGKVSTHQPTLHYYSSKVHERRITNPRTIYYSELQMAFDKHSSVKVDRTSEKRSWLRNKWKFTNWTISSWIRLGCSTIWGSERVI